MESDQIEALTGAFRDQLVALLEECAQGRRGLFSEYEHLGGEETGWPEAARLRELATALQSILAQDGERNALCDEFLDLCTMHVRAEFATCLAGSQRDDCSRRCCASSSHCAMCSSFAA
jgi:hypothetical protein